MRYQLFIVFFFAELLGALAYCQSAVDSVWRAAKRAEASGAFDEAVVLYEQYDSSMSQSGLTYEQRISSLKRIAALRYDKLGQPSLAIRYWKEALDLSRKADHKRNTLTFLINLGMGYASTAFSTEAEGCFLQAESLASALGDSTSLRTIYGFLVQLFRQGEDNERAAVYQKKLDEKVGSDGGATKGFDNVYHIARAAVVAGESERAFELLNEALTLAVGNLRGEAEVYVELANVHQSFGRLSDARRAFDSAHVRFKSIAHLPGVAASSFGLGCLAYAESDYEAAQQHLLTAISLHAKIDNTELLARDFFNLGLVYKAKRKAEEASDAFGRAVIFFERTRVHAAGADAGDDRRKFLAVRMDAYEQLIAALERTKDADLAFQVMELAQARTLFEALHDLGTVQVERTSTVSTATILKETSIAKLLRETCAQVNIPTADEVRFRLLDGESVLLEYFVGRHSAFVFVATLDHTLMVPLNGTPTEVQTRVSRLRDGLKMASAPDIVMSSCVALSSSLLGPIRQSIAGRKKLIVVPSGLLWTVPFEALIMPEDSSETVYSSASMRAAESFRNLDFVMKRMAITYCQSSSILYHNRNWLPAEPSLIAFADPSRSYEKFASSGDVERDSATFSLPASRAEVQSIAEYYPPYARTALMGDSATEAQAKQLLQYSRTQAIHFATHGFLTAEKNQRVGLVLNAADGEDGVLESSEIAQLKIHADVVVLSACETGLGSQIAGEGTMGLARAFAIAGARSVVVSLWRVADRSTAQLMQKFYEEFTRTGDAPNALHRAQQWMLTESQFSAPYYWAPFIIVGR